MSDFDFEELDRAVAGALDTPPAASRQDAGSLHAPLQDTGATRPRRPMQDIVPTQKKPASAPVVEKKPVAPAVRRQPGRVMDFMQPAGVARRAVQAQRVAPVGPPVKNPEPTAPAEAPVPASRAVDAPRPKRPEAKKSSQSAPRDEELEAPWSQPLDSPFLPDAKVEKRPLGGIGPKPPVFTSGPEPFAEEGRSKVQGAHEALSLPDFDSLNLSSPNDASKFFGYEHDTQDDDEVVEAPEAPRLAFTPEDEFPEVSTVHAADKAEAQEVPEEPRVQEEPDAPLLLEEPEDFFLEATAGPSNNLDESAVTEGYIRQQYIEEPREEEPTGAMYDTEAYHQALAPPAKKRSRIGLIVWLAVLVALGAAAGVLFYLYILPML